MQTLVLALILLARTAQAQVPIPDDLRLTPPAADVPASIARFAGAWGDAAWGGVLPTALIVESVRPDGSATIVYTVGAAAQFAIQGQWLRAEARVEGGHLVFRLGNTSLDYEPGPDNSLIGLYTAAAGWRSEAQLTPLPPDPRAALATPVHAPWQETRIALPTGQRLQAFLYPPRAPGPRPFVIFSHGSTDGERPGIRAIYPFTAEARFFLARGWGALAVMRRGRGLSDGPLAEAYDIPEQRQLDAGLEDLAAAIATIRARADADPNRILLLGQSRGGLLSLAYAARYPDQVAGVVNFSGGWWSEGRDRNGFNRAQAVLAGQRTRAPTLWLYADHDRYYSLPFIRGIFQAFRDAGGQGALLEFTGLPGNGHALIGFQDRWTGPLDAFLRPLQAR